MPEPVSVTMGFCLGYAALASYARSGTAISSEADSARQSAIGVVELAEQSYALFGSKSAALSELFEMASECSESDWDGEGTHAINPVAVATAESFVRALPEDVPLPEFAPEPDGSVSLEWIPSKHRRFVLSIGTSNRLAYAWLDGTDKGNGVARFDGQAIPHRVLGGIQSILNHAITPFRAA